MKSTRNITINIYDTTIPLDDNDINFYLSETHRRKIHKPQIEKFYKNLVYKFYNRDSIYYK
jgi:hypothetical protein